MIAPIKTISDTRYSKPKTANLMENKLMNEI